MFWANKSHAPFQLIATLIKALLVTNNVLSKKSTVLSFNIKPACSFIVCAALNNTLLTPKSPETFRAFAF